MKFGKKLSTLINATLRFGLSRSKRKLGSDSGNPESNLDTLRRHLADVEAKERELAGLLKVTHAKAKLARDEGRVVDADAQQRLTTELEAHLETQSTQAIALSKKLKAMKESLEMQNKAAQQAAAGNPASATDSAIDAGPSTPPAATDDTDLSARKSRLSD